MNFQPKQHKQIGLVGVGVMGSNLAQNIKDKGFRLNVYDYSADLRQNFSAMNLADTDVFATLRELVASLQAPRCIFIMIKSGNPVDQVITKLLPLLDKGDLLVDLGNSHYRNTERRAAQVTEAGCRYMGCGVSGGAEGARHGPAMMPGGDRSGWEQTQKIFENIAAHYESEPCANWVGPGGAGHFVKMTHNGIEYADMQLIAEAYQLMHYTLEMDVDMIADHFERWNQGPLQSYLLEISADILRARDTDGSPMLDVILDRAGQKGTGSWSTHEALDYGVPTTLITSAVMARVVSSFKAERVTASLTAAKQSTASAISSPFADEQILADLEQALYAAKLIAYAQGYQLMKAASIENDWALDLASITRGWRAGCIIRGALLNELLPVLKTGPTGDDALLGSHMILSLLGEREDALRRVVMHGISKTQPIPCLTAALNYLDCIRRELLPANMIQAQRDYFGAHGFQRAGAEDAGLENFNWRG